MLRFLPTLALSFILTLACQPISLVSEDSKPAVAPQPAKAEPIIPEGDFPGKARMILPPVVHAIEGLETNLYFDNTWVLLNPANYAPDVICSKGSQQSLRWTWTPEAKDVGKLPLSLELRDSANGIVARASTKFHVVARKPLPDTKPVRMLIIGDSLTAASVYPERILQLSKEDGLPLKLIGTRGPGVDMGQPLGEVRHEGYGGWTAEGFATRYQNPKEPKKEGERPKGSPFLFKENPDDPKEAPVLNLRRYCEETNQGELPNFVTILLGCNDVFGATDETIEEKGSTSVRYQETLISMIRDAVPDAWIGVIIIMPSTFSQDAFGKNYGSGQTRWQYSRNRQWLAERMIKQFSGREGERVELIGAHLNVDPYHGFPTEKNPANLHNETDIVRQSNAVHPSVSGYQQIGDTVYAWLRSHDEKSSGK